MDETDNFNTKFDLLDGNEYFQNLDPQPKQYIYDIASLLDKRIGLKNIVTISLFGSQLLSSDERSCISDCDLLIVVDNAVSNDLLKELEPYLLSLEIKHNYRTNHSDVLKRIIDTVQLTTGMFVSHFVTKENYCKKSKFYKMFHVSEFLSYLIAPRRIVINNVLENNCSLFGADLNQLVKTKLPISSFDMIKSLMMNLLISLCSFLILPFKSLKPTIRYQLEAIKWSLRAINYYIFRDTASLPMIIKRFSILEHRSFRNYGMFYKKFLFLRDYPVEDLKFMTLVPLKILKIHINGIKLRNLFKRIKNRNLKIKID
ncbi:MAG: hypothetical protein P8Y70_14370 [Candidatus Lokiarchaeota archaeon]